MIITNRIHHSFGNAKKMIKSISNSVIWKSESRFFSTQHIKLLMSLFIFFIWSSVQAQTFDTSASAYQELQPQFFEEGEDYINVYFNVKFEDRAGAAPVGNSGDNVFDHLEEVNLSWDGTVIYALEHIALKDQNLGSNYTKRTFDIIRFGRDTFREYLLTSISDDIVVTYPETSAYSGEQDVVQARVRIRKAAFASFSNPKESNTIRMYADYYDRGTNGNSLDHAGIHFSQSFQPINNDVDDDVESMFNLSFQDSGGDVPDSYDISFNIKYQDVGYDYDHLEEVNIQWNGAAIYALEHPGLKNQDLGSAYTIRTFDEDRVGGNDSFREYIRTDLASELSVSYDLETQNINGLDQDVIRVTVNVDRSVLHKIDPSGQTGKFRVYADYQMRGEDPGTNASSDITGTGEINVGTLFSNTYTIREEDSDASEELDFHTLDFNNDGYSRIGFKLSDYSDEQISDHIGCIEIWSNAGGSWSLLGNIRHSNTKFENDCGSKVSNPSQSDQFTYNGKTYIFALSEEARIEAVGGKYYKGNGDVEFTSGDPYIYIRHFVDSDDFNKSIAYKLGGTYILKDFDGEEKLPLWNSPGTTKSEQSAVSTTFDNIPDIAAPSAAVSGAQCGINISWTEPANTGWGDPIYHKVELLRDNKVIERFDAHDVVTHSNTFFDTDIDAGVTYNYQVRVAYRRDYNGSILGGLSSASSVTTDAVETPAGVATTQTSCDGDLTVSWVWPGGGNPNAYVIERDEDGSGFQVLDDAVGGSLLSYTDNTVVEGSQYTYRIAAFDGLCNSRGDFSPAVTHSRDTINLTSTIVKNALQTSKGYYNDRTELFWEMTGVNEQFVNQFNVYARELGSTVEPTLIENLERNDRSFFHERGEANVIYEYFVTTERVIETECGFEVTSSFNIKAVDGLANTYQHLPDSGVAYGIGLRNATAVVNGNVTYSGGIAVPDVKVIVEPESQIPSQSLYFNGASQVVVPSSQYIEVDTALTLSAWVKPERLDPNVMLFKGGSYGLEFNGTEAFMFVRDTVDQTAHIVRVPAEAYTIGTWVNLTCTYSSSTGALNLYVNGVKTGATVTVPESRRIINQNANDFLIGNYHSPGYEFQGNMDEIRIYNRALSADEVLRESGRITQTDARGLVAYWKVFEGTGNFLYDAAHQGSFFFKHDGELQSVAWSDDIPSQTQLGLAGYTNQFGNFSIEGIPFSGSGENFRVTPTITLAGVVHEFDPGSNSVYLGNGNLVENGVDFEDISAFEVSGRIVYDYEDTEGSGTKSYGSSGVQLLLDGITPMKDANGAPITTDANGNFTASVPIGLHYISFEKEDHTFSHEARWPAVGFNNFQADVSGIELFDQTLHKFVGTVAGGTSASKNRIESIYQINNIGKAYFDIRSQDNTIARRVETDSLSGTFEIELPPLEYNLSAIKWSIDDLDIVSSGDVATLNLASEDAYEGTYELDSILTPILSQSYPTTATEAAIANFRVDSVTATKIHYSWTLNNSNIVNQKHLWVNDTDTVEYFSDVDPSNFPTGLSDNSVTFAGTNAYNTNSELPNALLLEFINSSNEVYQVGVVFNGFTSETLYKYDTTGFEYVPDSIFYNERRDYIYRALPTLEVVTAGDTLFTGESIYGNNSDADPTVDLEQLPYPTFFTNDFYQLEIRANEIYTNKDNGTESQIPVIDGNITVNNGIGTPFVYGEDGRKQYNQGAQKSLDEEGVATYDFVAGDPSFVQITSTGEEQNSFTKTINVSLQVDGQSVTWPADPVNDPQRAYVLGIQPIPGANFITAAPETVEFILRDPPGSDSYAFREAGTTYSVSEEFIGSGYGGLNGSRGAGVAFDISGGGSFGGHIEIGGGVDATASIGLNMEVVATTGATVERSLETTQTITTNDEPVEVGASDVFVAKSHNLETGYAMRVQPLLLSDCGGNCFGDIITMQNGTQYQMGVTVVSYINPKGFPTYVVYTQNHIETVLIPDIEQLRNSILTENSSFTSNLAPDHTLYGTNNDDPLWGSSASSSNPTKTEAADLSGPSYTFDNGGDDTRVDSIRFYNQQIRLWKEALAFNEIEKWAAFNAGNQENVSLASGVSLERTTTNTSSSLSMITMETTLALQADIDISVNLIVAARADLDAELGLTTSSTSTRGEESSNTFGYVLRDSDENDSYSIDIAPGVGGNSPVFSTVAGQTSCPFEPGIEMKYATPEFIDRAIADREALIGKLTKSKRMTDILKTQVETEIAAISQDVESLKEDIKTYTESQIEMIKTKADATEIFNDIQSIVKSIGENAANGLVQKAVGPVVGGVNDFIGTLQDINIPVPFTRGVSPFEGIPTIPEPSSPTGDFEVDFSQIEAVMLKRLKDAQEIAEETVNRTTELILKVQSKVKKRLLDINNLTIRLKEFELDLDKINNEIDAVNAQILQFRALQSQLQSATEPIMLSNSTLQRENPTLLINGADEAQVYNVPAEEKANFNLLLGNESESGDAMYYNLSLITSSNPNGLVVSVDGLNIATPREFLVEGSGAIQKVLQVERGPFEYDYEDIKVLISSGCQYDPTSNTALIADTVSFDVKFLPTCTDLEILLPDANWVGNNQNNGVLPITVGGYDINSTGLENIKVQYKSQDESDWTLLETYFRDENAPDWQVGDEVLPQSGNTFTYAWDISSIPDGKYDIRAVSNCSLAQTTSEIHSGLIDKVNPQLFGSPQPADGVLSAGDEIMIQFNEPINAGLLTPSNFDMRGVLNGGTLRNEAAVDFNGTNGFMTIPSGINLARKSFSVGMKVQRRSTGEGVLLAQGIDNANGLTIGFNAADKPYLSLAGEEVVATSTITDNEWHHLIVAFDFESGEAFVYLDGTLVGLNNSFFADYTEAGEIKVGKSQTDTQFFDGYVHELRIWNKALAVTDVNVVANQRLSKTTPNLLANWEMEEANGSIAHEKVRLLHAQVQSGWKVFPSGESLNFDGTGFATSASPVVAPTQSFTVSFWFNTSGSNQTLLSTGRGDDQDANIHGWSFSINSSGQLLAINNEQIFLIADKVVNDGAWHHVAVSLNRQTTIKAFLDGAEANSISVASFQGLRGPHLWLGARGWNDGASDQQDQFYTGLLDEVRIWNTNRSLKQIQQDRYSKLSGYEEGLLGYFPMEKLINTGGVLTNQASLDNQARVTLGEVLTINGGITSSSSSPNIKLPKPSSKINFNYASNGDKIILTPVIDNSKIENTILNISVKNIQDLNGNVLQNPITWTAFVDKNQVIWLDEQINIQKNLGESYSFETKVVNQGGSVQDYTISHIPIWLNVSSPSGTLEPQSSEIISFTINEGLNIGEYIEDVYLSTSEGFTERLELEVKVSRPYPASWEVSPEDFQHSMSIIAQLKMEGKLSRDPDDVVAAFVDGEIRGIAKLRYISEFDNYQAYLSIYSNVTSGEALELRAWNASEGRLHTNITPNYNFEVDARHGTPVIPEVLEVPDYISADYPLVEGWQWLSFNLESPNFGNVNTFLSSVKAGEGDVIKGQENFDQYDPNTGWFGSLTASGGLENDQMYKLRLSDAGRLSVQGNIAEASSHQINVKPGWNWIGFVSQRNMNINQALAGYSAQINDEIKSQRAFAVYGGASVGWIGSLKTLEPGQGYLLFSQQTTSFVYPREGVVNGRSIDNEMIEKVAGYSFNYAKYPDNMSLIATIEGAGEEDMLLVFNEKELVGLALPGENPIYGASPTYFVNVWGAVNGTSLEFRKLNNEEVALTSQHPISFEINKRIGSISEPILLKVNQPLGVQDQEKISVYPNPFTNEVRFQGKLAQRVNLIFEIQLIDGRVIHVMDLGKYQDAFSYSWDGKLDNGSDINPGMYIARIHAGDQVFTYKIIKQ